MLLKSNLTLCVELSFIVGSSRGVVMVGSECGVIWVVCLAG